MAGSIRTFFATRWIVALVIVSILLLVIIPVSILLMRPAQELATQEPAAQERDASECVSTVEQTPATVDANGIAPTVTLQNIKVKVGEVVAVPIMFNHATRGLSGYIMDISLTAPEAARLASVEFPELGLTRKVSATGSMLRLAAVDLERLVEVGVASSTLATLSIEGLAEGTTEIRVQILKMDDDDGNPIHPGIATGEAIVCQ